MDFDPAIVPIMEQLTRDLRNEIPGLGKILDQADANNIMVTMTQLNEFLKVNPQHATKITELTQAAFAEPEEPQLPSVAVDTSKYPVPIDEAHIVVQPPGARIAMLNPILQGAIAERIQFDGDAPELRYGPLPIGANPAVPVDTRVRNPVMLGIMLDTASDEVQSEIIQLETEHEQKLLTSRNEIDLGGEKPHLPTGWEGETDLVAPDPEGYKKGCIPDLRKVGIPTVFDLASMTTEEKAAAAFKALSTTQGRRSATRTIREMVVRTLEEEGFFVGVNDNPLPLEHVPVYAEWTTSIQGGTHQNQFSFIDTAARVLGTRLAEQLHQNLVADPILEIMTINSVDVRQVGWAARVVSRYS